ncbi:hypothetical protein BX616_002795, partial [Lobosporangium transversale]
MSLQRFRSNSSSLVLDAPSSPTSFSSNVPQLDDISILTRCEPINVPLPSSPNWSHERLFQDPSPLSNSSRLSLSPMVGAAGVMKKLLKMRRGYTNSTGGIGVGLAGAPLSPTAMPSFVIVGGQGAMAAGSTVYDVDLFQSLPPSPRHPPFMAALSATHSSISPSSPKSPTFPHFMLTRFTGRDHRPPPMQISSPLMTPIRSRSPLGLSGSDSIHEPPAILPTRNNRKKLNRRSLSADSLWAAKGQRPPMERSIGSDGSIERASRQWKGRILEAIADDDDGDGDSKQSVESGLLSAQTRHKKQLQDQNDPELDFYKNPVDFLKMHHNLNTIPEIWPSRSKRESSVPFRRQSESSLLSRVLEMKNNHSETLSTKDLVPDSTQGDDDEVNPFGPGSCWKDLDPSSCPTELDVDAEYRSLLSSVDIMLVPTISSPTKFYDCPKSRQLVRTYLTAGEREFDEVVEYGFPSNAVIEDRDGRVKDCRFLTLRLTLTPWHARADESKLYGPGDAEKHMALKELVNRFFLRTSSLLSSSPPRATSDQKHPTGKGRKSPALTLSDNSNSHSQPTMHSAAPNHARSTQEVHPFDNIHTASPSLSLSLSSPLSLSFPSSMSTVNHTEEPESNPLSPTTPTAYSGKQTMSSSPPKNTVRNRTTSMPRKDKGFRILDPSASPTIRSVRSTGLLSNRDPAELYCTSPPSTPSPTSPKYGGYIHLLQQPLTPPRKGSLSAFSLPLNINASNHLNAVPATATATLAHEDYQTALAPVIPPRRKASSPTILSNEAEIHQHRPLKVDAVPVRVGSARSRTAPALFTTAAVKANATQSQSPSHAHFRSLQAVTTTNTTGTTASVTTGTTTLPIPIPGARNSVRASTSTIGRYPHQQLFINGMVDVDRHNSSVTTTSTTGSRIPRASSKKRLNRSASSANNIKSTMEVATRRPIIMSTSTLTSSAASSPTSISTSTSPQG